ncbi:hypothetical protein COCNU_scaffold020463G000030 [Cocos nucifera]|nr:hypothetical protein [Cocos nucifera]
MATKSEEGFKSSFEERERLWRDATVLGLSQKGLTIQLEEWHRIGKGQDGVGELVVAEVKSLAVLEGAKLVRDGTKEEVFSKDREARAEGERVRYRDDDAARKGFKSSFEERERLWRDATVLGLSQKGLTIQLEEWHRIGKGQDGVGELVVAEVKSLAVLEGAKLVRDGTKEEVFSKDREARAEGERVRYRDDDAARKVSGPNGRSARVRK